MRYFRFSVAAAFTVLATGFVFNGLALPAPKTPQKAEAAQTKPEISWGQPDVSGLQLGIYQTKPNSTIFCIIRNQGTEKIRFSDYYLDWGAPNGISFWARPIGKEDATWTKLASSGFYTNVSRGLGPHEKNRITLLPGRKYLTRLFFSSMNSTWPVDFEQSSRFVSPFAYIWPAQWSGAVEFKIEQELPNFDGDAKDLWEGRLTSGVLEGDVDEIRRLQAQALEHQKAFKKK